MRYFKVVTYIIGSSKKVDLFKAGRISVIKALFHPEAAFKVLVALVLINSVFFTPFFQRTSHGERLHHSNQILSVPLQPPLLCK